jgi:hypothetical protein
MKVDMAGTARMLSMRKKAMRSSTMPLYAAL